MYAVIKTGGKQYRVKEGDILAVEKVPSEPGHPVDFSQVLLIELADKVVLGTPFIAGAVVRSTAIENFKDEKVIVFKKKRKKQYRRTKGHRQAMTRVRIDEIVPDVAQAPERKPVAPIVKPAPKPAPAAVPEEKPVEAKKAPKKAPAHAPAKKVEKHEKHERHEKPAAKPAKPVKAERAKPEKKAPAHRPAVHPKKPSK
jgi:large subunit ribosomal protein L21